MNAIDLLKKQHEEAKELLSALEEAEVEEKEELFEKLADALAMHAAIEEQHFYPATKDARTEELLQEAVEEHLSAKRIIADLLEMEPDDPQFDAKIKVLQEQIEHHVEEEETELFPKVLKIHSKDEMEDLGVLMEQTAEELKEQGAPRMEVPKETGAAAPLE
ncbi:MAG: hemerythrin domain-containing protein [Myxococcales bacterium]